MIRRPPRSTLSSSSAASDVYKRQVGISSIAALRGQRSAPAYSASKAFVCNYLEGLRHSAIKSRKPIFITDVQPGFVKTPMSRGNNLFWISTAEKAASQIYDAIVKKKKHVYITKRCLLYTSDAADEEDSVDL